MWRARAIRSLLAEEVAGIRLRDAVSDPETEAREVVEELARAQRRALLVVVLCWLALAALLAMRRGSLFQLAGDETVFSLGVLAVAIYSGFRLGQLEKYRAVARAWGEVAAREEPPRA